MKFIFLILFTFNFQFPFSRCDHDIIQQFDNLLTTLNINHIRDRNHDQMMTDYHSKLKSTFPKIDPEAFMNVTQIIDYHGYPVEEHMVETSDGYILKIQRIPHGKKSAESGFHDSQPRKPVLVQHGLFTSSVSWVLNIPEKNLPYLLADAGYDVWLGNVRGNVCGLNHTKYSPKDLQFWEFSFDEMAKYDLTSVIDKMLNVTEFKQIYYIGHSMGTTMLFAMLSSKPEYNDIVKTAFTLAPITVVNNIRGMLRFFSHFADEAQWLYKVFGVGKFALPPEVKHIFAKTLCDSPVRIVCENLVFLTVGFDYSQANMSRLPVYLYHTPDASSIQNVIHYAQLIKSQRFQDYDFGTKENAKHYNQSTPPLYDLSKIVAPIAMFWSSNDYLADPIDVINLLSQLKNVTEVYHVPYNKFNHLDFVWALDAKELLYNKLLETMKKLWE